MKLGGGGLMVAVMEWTTNSVDQRILERNERPSVRPDGDNDPKQKSRLLHIWICRAVDAVLVQRAVKVQEVVGTER